MEMIFYILSKFFPAVDHPQAVMAVDYVSVVYYCSIMPIQFRCAYFEHVVPIRPALQSTWNKDRIVKPQCFRLTTIPLSTYEQKTSTQFFMITIYVGKKTESHKFIPHPFVSSFWERSESLRYDLQCVEPIRPGL